MNNKKKISFTLILITIFILVLNYKNTLEENDYIANKDVLFISASKDNNKLEVELNEKVQNKATIYITDIIEKNEEVETILTIKNNNKKLKATLKNLEVSGKSPEQLVRSASFPDGAKKIILNPGEETTVNVKVKGKDDIEDIKKIKFYVSYTIE